MNRNRQRLAPIKPIFLILLVALLAFFTVDASGQGGPGPGSVDRLEAELEHTDRILEEARSLLYETSNAKAEELVRQAETIQDRAWTAYRESQFRAAQQYTMNARNLIKKSMGLMHRRQENESFVEKEIERTDAMLERAREAAGEIDQDVGPLFLEQALRLQDRAREMFSEKNLKQALNLTMRARKMLHRIVGELTSKSRLAQRVDQKYERISRQLEQNRDVVYDSGNQNAVNLLNNAEAHLEKANSLILSGQHNMANIRLNRAVNLLTQAIRPLRGEDPEADAKGALSIAEDRFERLLDISAEQGTDDADALLDEIAEKLDKARELYAQGEYRGVLTVVRVVMELEQQAAKILGEW